MGKTIPKAKFEFMRADGDGKPICYYTVELENVMISGVNPDSGDGGTINEQVWHGARLVNGLPCEFSMFDQWKGQDGQKGWTEGSCHPYACVHKSESKVQ